MNPRPLGYETNDTRLRHPASSLATALASANSRQQVSCGLACLPHLTASPPCPVYKPVYRSGSLACADPTRRTHAPADHPAPPAPHSADPSQGGTRLASPRRDGPHRITEGQRDVVSRQTRTPRVRGPVPSGTRISHRATARHGKLMFEGPNPVPFEQNDSGRVGAWRPGAGMSVQILLMCALEWLSASAGNDRAVLLWSPPGAGLAAAPTLLAVWRALASAGTNPAPRGIDGASVTRR